MITKDCIIFKSNIFWWINSRQINNSIGGSMGGSI